MYRRWRWVQDWESHTFGPHVSSESERRSEHLLGRIDEHQLNRRQDLWRNILELRLATPRKDDGTQSRPVSRQNLLPNAADR